MGRPAGLLALAAIGALSATAAAASEEDPAAPSAPPVTAAAGAPGGPVLGGAPPQAEPGTGAPPPAAARGLEPLPAGPPPGERPDGRPARTREVARATRAGLVLELRSDFGLERLVLVEFTTDRRAAMNLNDGLGVSVGVSFLPLANGRLVTRATGGFKLARLRAGNGRAMFTAFPLELTEAAYVGPLRLGAGLSILLAPRVSGEDVFEESRITFAAAPGAVVDAEWLLSARGRTGIGVRLAWNRFAWRGTSRGAPSLGLVIRADFDLAGGR